MTYVFGDFTRKAFQAVTATVKNHMPDGPYNFGDVTRGILNVVTGHKKELSPIDQALGNIFSIQKENKADLSDHEVQTLKDSISTLDKEIAELKAQIQADEEKLENREQVYGEELTARLDAITENRGKLFYYINLKACL